jgi:hypothetical protein
MRLPAWLEKENKCVGERNSQGPWKENFRRQSYRRSRSISLWPFHQPSSHAFAPLLLV